ncbi:MAG: hypothetical protein HRU35_03265 [Rickettsiaceae bacterium]|nr:hypothetical protein [Rickettsiaceae bacterium]
MVVRRGIDTNNNLNIKTSTYALSLTKNKDGDNCMSENSKNQSKNGNNENQISTSDKNNNKDKHVRRVDENLDKLDENSPLANYNAASQQDKDTLEQYTNFDNLSKEEQENPIKRGKEAKDSHDENNRRHVEQAREYLNEQTELVRMSELLEHVFNNLKFNQFTKSIKTKKDWEYMFHFCSHSSEWRNIKSQLKIIEAKELMLNKIATDLFKALENDDWLFFMAKKD